MDKFNFNQSNQFLMMLCNDEQCNLCLRGRNGEIKVHSVILSASSELVRQIFINLFQETNSYLLILTEFSIECIRNLVHYVYSGTFVDGSRHTDDPETIALAGYLQVELEQVDNTSAAPPGAASSTYAAPPGAASSTYAAPPGAASSTYAASSSTASSGGGASGAVDRADRRGADDTTNNRQQLRAWLLRPKRRFFSSVFESDRSKRSRMEVKLRIRTAELNREGVEAVGVERQWLIQTEDGLFFCGGCEHAPFRSQAAAERHVDSTHVNNDDPSLICNDCHPNRKFISQKNKARHMLSKHTEFTCKRCKGVFLNKKTFSTHLQNSTACANFKAGDSSSSSEEEN